MAGKKLTRKDPLAEARAARAELRAGVANAVNDALPVVGSDSNAWGTKLNQFLIDTLVLLVSKVSSINGVTPNPATGDVDLSGMFAAAAEPIALTKVPLPSAGDPVGGVPTKQSGGTVTYEIPSTGTGFAVVDNGDGTFTLTGSAVADNGDGTYTVNF